MKSIICPACGSVKVTLLENGKGICLACDTLFSMNDYSEEFEKTASHIDKKTDEIIQKIDNIQNRSHNEQEEYKRLLEKAQSYVELGDKSKAIECAKSATELIPEKAAGYIELYRIWTNEYSSTDNYKIFLNTEESEQADEVADAVKKALKCSDCDPDFSDKVVDFQKRCTEYALSKIEKDSTRTNKNIEDDIIKNKEGKKSSLDAKKEKIRELKKKNWITRIAVAVIALILFVVSIILGGGEPSESLMAFAVVFTAIFLWIYVGVLIWKKIRGFGGALVGFFGGIVAMTPIAWINDHIEKFESAEVVAIMEIILLLLFSIIIIRKLNKKRKEEIKEIRVDSEEDIRNMELRYGRNKSMYEERLRGLEEERKLYNEILNDAQMDDSGKKLLTYYINKLYRI
ncbi:MAG: hypothetical protein K2J95_01130 [Lachnospiraceae bacterium]|nr:hypothetical protein [Lachnospiraceae bacterium]